MKTIIQISVATHAHFGQSSFKSVANTMIVTINPIALNIINAINQDSIQPFPQPNCSTLLKVFWASWPNRCLVVVGQKACVEESLKK